MTPFVALDTKLEAVVFPPFAMHKENGKKDNNQLYSWYTLARINDFQPRIVYSLCEFIKIHPDLWMPIVDSLRCESAGCVCDCHPLNRFDCHLLDAVSCREGESGNVAEQ